MSSYLCIDPGLAHTGFATSDSTRLVQPLMTVHTKDKDKILKRTLSIIRQQKPDEIVIGQPLFGPIHSLAQELFDALKPHFSGPIHIFSEDLSSKIALKKLIQSGSSKHSRREKKHSAAAAVILEEFLNSSFIW